MRGCLSRLLLRKWLLDISLVFLTYISYMALFWSFSVAGGFLPLILRAKGVDAKLSVEETYRSYIYICKLTPPHLH
jgi:hypothetical protein